MTQVHQLTYGPFAENTYLITDADDNALVIDPGMYHPQENTHFFEYLNQKKIKPGRLLLTHAHLDHVFGVHWVNKQYNLVPEVHQEDKIVYDTAVAVAKGYGLNMQPLVAAKVGLAEGDIIELGSAKLSILHAPGHSPGSVCFYNAEEGYLIGGDVLFQGSIGRTDLPGGDFDKLINSIRTKLMDLPDDTTVYSGHGAITTIGQERISNPYL
ncbi:MBL fold metallo-hydrolase [Bacteroidia bacterium]|jgi:hydroxyacylglutathione hydrolase|nr:MBL fold metallo-hydrolase [Bacteroidia bacterium]|tara:strand:+ start:671 stop:1306 length:636 start_codon:yes stop_codon:yes gene_type:complete